MKNGIDFRKSLCYDVIGKESRVSALTRHKRVTMVQYLINETGRAVSFESMQGG